MRYPLRSGRGFTLVELVVVTAVVGILAAIALPVFSTLTDRMRLNQSAREVERTIHQARQKAVSSNRAMRIRFNCPAPGQYRMVELLGSPSAPSAVDSAANRCSDVSYPYPADRDPATRPNLDGPVRRLDTSVAFGAVQTIEFWPDGSAHDVTSAPGPLLPTTGASLTLTKGTGSYTRTATITVNGIGKVKLNPVQ